MTNPGLQIKTLLTDPLTIAIGASVFLLLVGELLSPGFAQGSQIVRLLTIAAILGIVAAGQNLVILGGREGIDLSVGAMISLGAVLAGNMMNGQNAGIPLAILVAGGIPFLIGLINGLGITFVRIPPLVMTLGMTAVIQGGLVVYSQGVPSGAAAPCWRVSSTGRSSSAFPACFSSGWASPRSCCSCCAARPSVSPFMPSARTSGRRRSPDCRCP